MEKLDGVFRAAHKALVDGIADQHRAHGNHPVGDALGRGDDVGHHAEPLTAERRTDAVKRGDHLIED